MKVTRGVSLLALWLALGSAHAAVNNEAGLREIATLRGEINAVFGVSSSAELKAGAGKLTHDSYDAWTIAGWRLSNAQTLEALLSKLEGSSYPNIREFGTCSKVSVALAGVRGRIVQDAFNPEKESEIEAYKKAAAAYDAAIAALSGDESTLKAQPAAQATTTAATTATASRSFAEDEARQDEIRSPNPSGGQGAPAPDARPGAPISLFGVESTNAGITGTPNGQGGPAGVPYLPPVATKGGPGGTPPFLPPFQGPAQIPPQTFPGQMNPAWQGANTISISVDPRTGGISINGNPQLIAQILTILNAFAAQGGNGVGPINMGIPNGPGGIPVFPGQQQPYPGQQFPFPGQQAQLPYPGQQQPYPYPGQQQPYPYPGQQQPYPYPGQQQPYPYPGQQQPYPYPQQPVAGLPQQPVAGIPQQPGGPVFNPAAPGSTLPFDPNNPQNNPANFPPLQPQQPIAGLPQQPVAGLPQQPVAGIPNGVPAGPVTGLPPVPGKGGVIVQQGPNGGVVITLPGGYPGAPVTGVPGAPGTTGQPTLAGAIDPQGNLYGANGQPVGVRAVPGGNGQVLLVDQNGYQVGRIVLERGQNGQTIGTMVSNAGQVLGQVVYGPDGAAQIYDIRNQGGYQNPQGPISSYPPIQSYPPISQYPYPPTPGKGGVVLPGPGQYPGQFPNPGQVGQYPYPPTPGKGGVVLPGPGQVPGQFPGQFPGQMPYPGQVGQYPYPPTPGKGGGVVIVERPPYPPPYQGGGYQYPWDDPNYVGTPPFIPTGPAKPFPFPQSYPTPWPNPAPSGGKKINGTEVAISAIIGGTIGAIASKNDRVVGAVAGAGLFTAADLILQSIRKDKNPNPPPPYTVINPNLPDKGPLVMQNGQYGVYQNGAMVNQWGQQVLSVNQEGLIMGPRGDFIAKLK